MMYLGLGLRLGARRGGWRLSTAIRALFANGETGSALIIDPAVPDALWQDAAGTIPATAPGDPVALVIDQSGNGVNAIQNTDTDYRPTLARMPKGGVRNLLDGSGSYNGGTFTTEALEYTISTADSVTITLSGTSTAGPLVGPGSLTFTPTAGTLTLAMSAAGDVQFETGSTATPYQSRVNALDVTEDGVDTVWYLNNDGDDYLTLQAPDLGTNATLAWVDPEDVGGASTYLTGQTISGNTDLNFTRASQIVVTDDAWTAGEKSAFYFPLNPNYRNYSPVYNQLPSPTGLKYASTSYVGLTTATAVSDGVDWKVDWVDVDPWWLPKDAAFHADFDNDRFYWNGAERSLSDFSVGANGAYYLDGNVFGFTDTAFVELDVSADGDGVANWTGHAFSWTSGWPSGNRIEFELAGNSYGDNMRLYCSPGNPTADYTASRLVNKSGEGGAVYIHSERTSYRFRIKNNTMHDVHTGGNGYVSTETKGAGSLATPTRVAIGGRAWAPGEPDSPLTDATVRRVTVWNAEPTADLYTALMQDGDARPVHLLGDSFLNAYNSTSRLREQITDAGLRVTVTQDGVGGTTITQQATRFAAYTGMEQTWWNSTLVICDFGFEGTSAEAITAINSMVGNLNMHSRWIYMQAAPSSALSAGEIAQGGTDKDMDVKAAFPDNYVSTLAEAWAESDGSPADEALVVQGLWPLSLRISAADFHPSNLGHEFIAQRIFTALKQRGWL